MAPEIQKIKAIVAREVLDSRGFPTLEAEVHLADGIVGSAMVPSGASTGENEALELRDGDKSRFLGKGVLKAADNIRHKIAPALIGRAFARQTILDDLLRELDGTENKSHLGANALLAVSMAHMRALSLSQKTPLYSSIAHILDRSGTVLPVPLMNIVNGGAHADNSLQIQEFMIAPVAFDSFREALRAGVEVFHHLKALLKSKNLATNVGDEGGFAPQFEGKNAHEQALMAVVQAIVDAGYRPGKDIFVALDVASSELVDPSGSSEEIIYRFEGERRKAKDMVAIYERWIDAYPIISIEDGLSEHDWTGWSLMTERLNGRCQIVGDDLFVTNPKFLQKGIDQRAANAILVKLNQIGTVTETLEAMKLADQAGYAAISSHRSGETEDSFIADLAVGTECGQIKTGSASRSDRVAKYNRLLKIEDNLGERAKFAGRNAFPSVEN